MSEPDPSTTSEPAPPSAPAQPPASQPAGSAGGAAPAVATREPEAASVPPAPAPALQAPAPSPAYPPYATYPQALPPASLPPAPGAAAPSPGAYGVPHPPYLYAPYALPAPAAAQSASSPYAIPTRRQSPVWRVVKWPLRQVIKGVYLTGVAARRHRAVTAVLLLLLLLFGGGTFAVYRVTHPAIPAPSAIAGQSTSANTPFTIASASQPPLASGVIDWLHAYKTFNGQEQWNALSPQLQNALRAKGEDANTLQNDLNTIRDQHVVFEQFIYSGGYLVPDGTAHYTIEAIYSIQGRQGHGIATWYFEVDSNGAIVNFQDLTPQNG